MADKSFDRDSVSNTLIVAVGLSLVCSVLVSATAVVLKPVQAGDLDHTDTDKVKALVSFSPFHAHEEAFRLSAPMSPHAAAAAGMRDLTRYLGLILRPGRGDLARS